MTDGGKLNLLDRNVVELVWFLVIIYRTAKEVSCISRDQFVHFALLGEWLVEV